jgi:hypothetical protein
METKLQAGIYLQTLHKEIFNKNSAKKVILPTKDYHICMTNMPEYVSTNMPEYASTNKKIAPVIQNFQQAARVP